MEIEVMFGRLVTAEVKQGQSKIDIGDKTTQMGEILVDINLVNCDDANSPFLRMS